ncbi:MAG: DUF2341 domain-containing protein, partial [Fervidobacterium sp.]|nr:DUF2341 domain-containing protein [Fervidobacterium sp.]
GSGYSIDIYSTDTGTINSGNPSRLIRWTKTNVNFNASKPLTKAYFGWYADSSVGVPNIDWLAIAKYNPNVAVSLSSATITITNNSGSTLTDDQISVLASQLGVTSTDESLFISKSAFKPVPLKFSTKKLGFVKSSAIKYQYYWLEHDSNNTPTGNVWIKINLPKRSSASFTFIKTTQTVAGDSYNNGEKIFEFFDDFNNLNTTKWSVYTNRNHTIQVIDGKLYFKSWHDSLSGGWILSKQPLSLTKDYGMVYHANIISPNGLGMVGSFTDMVNYDTNYWIRTNYVGIGVDGSYARLFAWNNSTTTTASASLSNKWVTASFEYWRSSKKVTGRVKQATNTYTPYGTTASSALANLYIQLGQGRTGFNGEMYLDWVAIRKVVAETEPTLVFVTQIATDTYRVIVTNNSDYDLTDYQVAVPFGTLTSDTRFFVYKQNDTGDISLGTSASTFTTKTVAGHSAVSKKFVNTASYWIERTDVHDKPYRVWIKFPKLIPGVNVFRWYKTPRNDGNANNVFEYFTDFDNISDWQQVGGTGATTSYGIMNTFGYSIERSIPFDFKQGYIAVSLIKADTGTTSGRNITAFVGNSQQTAGNANASAHINPSAKALWASTGYYNSYDIASSKAPTNAFTSGVWYISELMVYPYTNGQQYNFDVWATDVATINSGSPNRLIRWSYVQVPFNPTKPMQTIWFGWKVNTDFGVPNIDWFAIAKYNPNVSATVSGNLLYITNNSGRELTDFQVPVLASQFGITSAREGIAIMSWNKQAQLRHTAKFLGLTKVPSTLRRYYWIERDVNGNPTGNIWLRVTIPRGQSKNFRLVKTYTWDSVADSYNKPSEIFDYFNDFDTFDGSLYETNTLNGTVTVSNSRIQLVAAASTTCYAWLTFKKPITELIESNHFSGNFRVILHAQKSGVGDSQFGGYIGLTDRTGRINSYGYYQNMFGYRIYQESYVPMNSTSWNGSVVETKQLNVHGSWLFYTLVVDYSNYKIYPLLRWTSNSVTTFNQFDIASKINSFSPLYLQFGLNQYGIGPYSVNVDWVAITKVLPGNVEPTVNVSQINEATYNVVITNNTNYDLYGYHVIVPISPLSKDVRFYVIEDLSNTELKTSLTVPKRKSVGVDMQAKRLRKWGFSFWIERTNNMKPYRVWVKFPTLVPGKNVFRWYKTDSTGPGNGTGVFEYFTDFDSLSDWQQVGGTGATVTNGIVNTFTYSIQRSVSFDFKQGYIGVSLIKADTGTASGRSISNSVGYIQHTSSNGNSTAMIHPLAKYGLYACTGNSASFDIAQALAPSNAFTNGKWYISETIVYPRAMSGYTGFEIWSTDVSTIDSGTPNRLIRWAFNGVNFNPNKPFQLVWFGWGNGTNDGVPNIDWFAIAKYSPYVSVTVHSETSNEGYLVVQNDSENILTDWQIPIVASDFNIKTISSGVVIYVDKQVNLSTPRVKLLSVTKSKSGKLTYYWMEHDQNNNPTGNVWVKVSIPARQSKRIYVVKTDSGDDRANSYHDGTKVFEIFDDFDNLDRSKWNIINKDHIIQTNSGRLYLKSNGSAHNGGWLLSKSQLDASYDYGMVFYANKINYYPTALNMLSGFTENTTSSEGYYASYYAMMKPFVGIGAYATSVRLYSYTDTHSIISVNTVNQWTLYSVDYFRSAKKVTGKVRLGSNTYTGTSTATSALTRLFVQIGQGEYGTNYQMYVDWLAVRKVVSETEPTSVSIVQISNNEYEVTIENNSDYNLLDYQVAIPFTNLTGSTRFLIYDYDNLQIELKAVPIAKPGIIQRTLGVSKIKRRMLSSVSSYWVERTDQNKPYRVWFKFKKIPVGTTTYMWQKTSTNTGNPNDTFVYFTDFDTLAGWTASGTTVTNGIVNMSGGYIERDLGFDFKQGYIGISLIKAGTDTYYGRTISVSVGNVQNGSSNSNAAAHVAPWSLYACAGTGNSTGYDIFNGTAPTNAFTNGKWYVSDTIIYPSGSGYSIDIYSTDTGTINSGNPSRLIRWTKTNVNFNASKPLTKAYFGW